MKKYIKIKLYTIKDGMHLNIYSYYNDFCISTLINIIYNLIQLSL